jgi:uncharacterized protein
MTLRKRILELDWESLQRELDERGYAQTPRLLTPEECDELVALYDRGRFRSRVEMARHRFGEGEYKYFDQPLPDLIVELRSRLYSQLARVANRWAEALGNGENYPENHEDFLTRCHERGQCKPTPLLLRYEEGGYNCLHQDLYGAIAFPLQVVFLLSRPDVDFTGGEFLLVEQRPRAQSRGEAITIGQGEAAFFTNRERPVAGTRGFYRVNVRHGISRVRSGRRFTLGIIFHDAE